MIFGKKKIVNLKYVFWFSLQRLSETFLIPRRTDRDRIKNVFRTHVKYPLFMSEFNENLISQQTSEKPHFIHEFFYTYVHNYRRCSLLNNQPVWRKGIKANVLQDQHVRIIRQLGQSTQGRKAVFMQDSAQRLIALEQIELILTFLCDLITIQIGLLCLT